LVAGLDYRRVTVIAAAVEEQRAATTEISRNFQEAARGTREVTETIGNVAVLNCEAGNAGALLFESVITMGLQQSNIEALPFVTGELNYLAPASGKPRTHAYDPPPGELKSTALPEPHEALRKNVGMKRPDVRRQKIWKNFPRTAALLFRALTCLESRSGQNSNSNERRTSDRCSKAGPALSPCVAKRSADVGAPHSLPQVGSTT